MKLIRSLVFPWFVFFAVTLTVMFLIGVKIPRLQQTPPQVFLVALGIGCILCLMANLRSFGKVGIWMSESLPESLRYGGSFRWIFRALQSVAVGAAFWGIGQLSWVPLIWHAAVVPFVFTICLFVAIFSLLGPILKWSSNVAWSRAFSFVLSLPVFATVPLTGLFVGQTIVHAYRASHAEMVIAQDRKMNETEKIDPLKPISLKARVVGLSPGEVKVYGEWPLGSGKKMTILIETALLSPKSASSMPKATTPKEITLRVEPKALQPVIEKVEPVSDRDVRTAIHSSKADKRAAGFRELYETQRGLCPEFSKEIQMALDPKGNKDVVLWAAKDVECAELRSAIALPRLVTLMQEHQDPLVRAAAIHSMRKFGEQAVRQVSYLLVKRLADHEPPEVVEATAAILAPLGGETLRWSTNKLKALLDGKNVSQAAASALIKNYNREDLVAEYVAQNLTKEPDARLRAVAMICLLPKPKRTIAESHVDGILASIKTADQTDPGIRALDCLGKTGFQAIRQEVSQPKQLDRAVAARALAEFNVKDEVTEALQTADQCARDENQQVRKWCSQTLGKIGAPALPKILDLLNSSDTSLKESGRNALSFFDDPAAKPALEVVLRENSGWMANARKLQIAQAVGTALVKIDKDKIEADRKAQFEADTAAALAAGLVPPTPKATPTPAAAAAPEDVPDTDIE